LPLFDCLLPTGDALTCASCAGLNTSWKLPDDHKLWRITQRWSNGWVHHQLGRNHLPYHIRTSLYLQLAFNRKTTLNFLSKHKYHLEKDNLKHISPWQTTRTPATLPTVPRKRFKQLPPKAVKPATAVVGVLPQAADLPITHPSPVRDATLTEHFKRVAKLQRKLVRRVDRRLEANDWKEFGYNGEAYKSHTSNSVSVEFYEPNWKVTRKKKLF